MKAITFHGVGDVRVENVADPKIVDPSDVVVKITTGAVCGIFSCDPSGRWANP